MGEDNDAKIVMTGLVPVIHVVELPKTPEVAANGATWMAGTSPAMTEKGVWKRYESFQEIAELARLGVRAGSLRASDFRVGMAYTNRGGKLVRRRRKA